MRCTYCCAVPGPSGKVDTQVLRGPEPADTRRKRTPSDLRSHPRLLDVVLARLLQILSRLAIGKAARA